MKTPLLLIALTLWACDTLECGPGTHRERDLCVANARVVCADGTALVDGRCVAVEGNPPAADATIDAAADVDATPPSDADVGSADAADAARLDDADVAPPDQGPPPQLCPPDRTPSAAPADCGALPPGEAYCVVGLALDFTTGCALPEGLPLLLIDPALAAAGQPIAAYTRGEAVVGPGGAFAVVGTGAAQQLALIFDDAEQLRAPAPGQGAWVRSVAGVSALAADPGRTYVALAFATSQDQQGTWNALLGRAAGFLEANGFLVGRVFTRDDAGRLRPRADAAVSTVGAPTAAQCAPDGPCLRFFDATPNLDALLPVGAQRTSLSGAFLFIRGGDGAYRSVFNVTDPAGVYATLPGGANIGSGFHLPFVPTL